MYGEIGAKAFCRTEPFEGKKFFIGCVSAESGRSSKGHGCVWFALHFAALSSSKRRLKKRMMDCTVRWFESNLQATEPLEK